MLSSGFSYLYRREAFEWNIPPCYGRAAVAGGILAIFPLEPLSLLISES